MTILETCVDNEDMLPLRRDMKLTITVIMMIMKIANRSYNSVKDYMERHAY